MGEPVLEVEHLSIDYVVGAGRFHALTDVSLRVDPGQVVGIVGETGCGKSTLARAIPRLLPQPPAEVIGGRVRQAGWLLRPGGALVAAAPRLRAAGAGQPRRQRR